MVKKIIALGVLFLLIVPLVFALEVSQTKLTINTKPNHDVDIKITNSESGNKVQSLTKKSGESGIIDVFISSIGTKDLDIEINLEKDFVEVMTESFGPFPIKTPITIDIGLELEPVVEEVTDEVVEETVENSVGITGQAISEEDEKESIISKTFLLIAGLVIVVGFIGFLGMRFFKNRSNSPSSIVVRKQSEILKEKQDALEDAKDDNEKITELEEKMNDIRTEMNKIKNEDKIKNAEKRIREEQERLERLRQGDE
tara:strand:+ start:920 stop:1687 length:768 start_codon:yes stop_codon:yes gene_type:complete